MYDVVVKYKVHSMKDHIKFVLKDKAITIFKCIQSTIKLEKRSFFF